MIGTDAFQKADTYGLTIPITKHNFLVRSAKDLLNVVPAAFRIAMSDRPGPVLIDAGRTSRTRWSASTPPSTWSCPMRRRSLRHRRHRAGREDDRGRRASGAYRAAA